MIEAIFVGGPLNGEHRALDHLYPDIVMPKPATIIWAWDALATGDLTLETVTYRLARDPLFRQPARDGEGRYFYQVG